MDYMVKHHGFSVGPFSTLDAAQHYLRFNAAVPGKIVTLDEWRHDNRN